MPQPRIDLPADVPVALHAQMVHRMFELSHISHAGVVPAADEEDRKVWLLARPASVRIGLRHQSEQRPIAICGKGKTAQMGFFILSDHLSV